MSSQSSSSLRPQQLRAATGPSSLRQHQSSSLDHHHRFGLTTSSSDSDSQVPSSVASALKYHRRRRPRFRRTTHRIGHYTVNPFASEVNANNHQFYASHSSALPREPSTTSTSSTSTSSSSSPSAASFDLPQENLLNKNKLNLDLVKSSENVTQQTSEQESLGSPVVPANCRRLKEPRNSSTFWDVSKTYLFLFFVQ